MNLKQQPKNPFESFLQKEKIKYIPSSFLNILDIGCGDGSVFEGTRFNVDGYDIDSDALKLACQVPNYSRVSTNLKDFNPAKYDCVTLLGVLEHMEPKDIKKLFKYLLPAKRIYITVPNANSFHRGIGAQAKMIEGIYSLGPQDIEIGHKRYYDYKRLIEEVGFFMNKGFSVQNAGTLGFKFDTSQKMSESYMGLAKEISREAEKREWVGPWAWNGAELFIYLDRCVYYY